MGKNVPGKQKFMFHFVLRELFANAFYCMLSWRKVQADAPSLSRFSEVLLCFQNQVQLGEY